MLFVNVGLSRAYNEASILQRYSFFGKYKGIDTFIFHTVARMQSDAGLCCLNGMEVIGRMSQDYLHVPVEVSLIGI